MSIRLSCLTKVLTALAKVINSIRRNYQGVFGELIYLNTQRIGVGSSVIMYSMNFPISAIVPTIGRPESLTRLLVSLAKQTHRVAEVVIADGSTDQRTAEVIADPRWAQVGLSVRRVQVSPPHAVKQRQAAIAAATGDMLLLLDDDVELEQDCTAELLKALQTDTSAVAVMADFNNQSWAMPTHAWRIYLRVFYGYKAGQWQGKVIGPLLRYGFNPAPPNACTCEWFASGNTLLKRDAFVSAGGFSEFFLHRSTMNEDVDLALRMAKHGKILFCPQARLGHFHDPGGRVSAQQAAEDDLFNRYHVLKRTCGHSRLRAFGLVLTFAAVEGTSNLAGALRRGRWGQTGQLLRGRLSALGKTLLATLGANDPPASSSKTLST